MPGNPVIVLPTGAGKSVVIAELCRVAVEQWNGRVLVLAHRKELLQQNGEKTQNLLPTNVKCGIYSAGLRSFDTDSQVVCCGIQSVFRKPEIFGARHLVLIDEVHLVPHDGEGMYRKFLDALRLINGNMRMIGLTATPFRTDSGALCAVNGLFQRICYEAKIPELIERGYLCRVTSKPNATKFNTSGLHVRAGEFIASEMERVFDADEAKVLEACKEIVANTIGRHSILIFCCGVAHAERVATTIEKLTGEQVGVVTGQTTALERSGCLESFRSKSLRWLVNVDVLTTGFDAPVIDAIAILRATMSPGLFAQICGRGLRIDPSKQDCLILDFGNNIDRHGPLDAIDYGKGKKGKGTGDAPIKTCMNCGSECPASARECAECGLIFPPPQLLHDETADTASEILATPKKFDVLSWSFATHQKKNAPDAPETLRVDYVCCEPGTAGNLSEIKISEWVCLGHDAGSFAKRKADQWWREHSLAFCPDQAAEAVDLNERGAVKMPHMITAYKEGRWWRIVERKVVGPLPVQWRESLTFDEQCELDSQAF